MLHARQPALPRALEVAGWGSVRAVGPGGPLDFWQDKVEGVIVGCSASQSLASLRGEDPSFAEVLSNVCLLRAGQAGSTCFKSRGCLTGWSPLSPRRTRSEGFQCRWDWWAIPRVALPRRGLHYEESPSLIYAVRLHGPRRAHSPALQAECGFGHVPFRVSAAGGCTALVF